MSIKKRTCILSIAPAQYGDEKTVIEIPTAVLWTIQDIAHVVHKIVADASVQGERKGALPDGMNVVVSIKGRGTGAALVGMLRDMGIETHEGR